MRAVEGQNDQHHKIWHQDKQVERVGLINAAERVGRENALDVIGNGVLQEHCGREHLQCLSYIEKEINRLYPVESAFFVNPNVSNNQNSQENSHFEQSKHSQSLELHGPRKKEDRFHIEDDEQDRNNVETNRVASAGVRFRLDPA